ncbi:hypothetical protein H8E06_00530 [bacterium]|nr:hypothetical protein [bacterium]
MTPNKSIFKIIKETPLNNGYVEWEVEYSSEFREIYKTVTGKKRVHEKSLAKWFVSIITEEALRCTNLLQKE